MERLCGACKRDSQQREAVKFCVQCDEDLCSGCCDAHNKIKALQSHVFADTEADASGNAFKNQQTVNPGQCVDHAFKRLEFFCTGCNKTGCSECMSDHTGCNTVHIPEVPQSLDVSRSEDADTLKEKTREVKTGIGEVRTKAEANVTEIYRKVRNIDKVLEELKNQVIAIFTVLSNDINKFASETAKQDELYCASITKRSEKFLNNLQEDFKESPEGKGESANSDQSMLIKKIKAMNATLSQLPHPHYGDNANHRAFMEKLNRIETFVETVTALVTDTKELAIPERLFSDNNTEVDDDEEENRISGALMTGTRLLVADRGNRKVKVFNTTSRELIVQLKLPNLFQDD